MAARIVRGLGLHEQELLRSLEEVIQHKRDQSSCNSKGSLRNLDNILSDAGGLVERFRHPYIGSEHLLYRAATYDSVFPRSCPHFRSGGGQLLEYTSQIALELFVLHGNCHPLLPWEVPLLGEVIGMDNYSRAKLEAHRKGILLSKQIVEESLISDAELLTWNKVLLGLEVKDLDSLEIATGELPLMNKDYVWSRKLLPIATLNGTLYVAIHEDEQVRYDEELTLAASPHNSLSWVRVPYEQLLKAIERNYGPPSR